jgi:hypothetical protein
MRPLCPRKSKESHEKLQSGQAVLRNNFEPWTFRLRNRSDNYSTQRLLIVWHNYILMN